MNYQLMAQGFPAVDIAKKDRLEYFRTLEAYAVDGDLAPFAEMIAGLTDRQLDQYIWLIEQSRESRRREQDRQK